MKPRRSIGSAAGVAVMVTLAVYPATSELQAGTLGKLTGVVVDAKNQPLAGANVILVGIPFGGATDLEGRYAIFNIPAGTYSVKVSLIGYAPTTVQGVAISADHSTALDVTLRETAVEMKEVVVTARRPVVDLRLTSNVATVTRQEIAKLPVQELQDIVNLQAGVVDGHIRGGRKDEVQFQVDGITVNNPYDNTATVRLDRSVLEEVQVISGTFDAEYGQAMSGVVNAVLKRGTERFEWSGEVFQGDYVYPRSSFPFEYEFRPGTLQNYQLTVSGPTPMPNTLFLLSGRYGVKRGPLEGQRRFAEIDRSDPDSIRIRLATPDRVQVGYTNDRLFLAKVTNRSIPGAEMSYAAIVNRIEKRDENFDFRLLVDALPLKHTTSLVHGFEWTHTLNKNTFYRLTARQNYFDYRDMVFDDVWDPRYDLEGVLFGVQGFEHGAWLIGVDQTRFIQRTNAFIFSGSLSQQLSRTHQVKAGIEVQPMSVRFGHPGYLTWLGDRYKRHVNEPAEGYPDPLTFRPVSASAYGQDEIEWNDLRLRGGLRLEYFHPNTHVPGDPANPANSLPGSPSVPPRVASRKITLSPRLGVSYPVTSKSSLFFAYGHFYQMPQLGQMYDNADYSVLRNLQDTDDKDYGTLGNPDAKPEGTIQYQFGYKHELRDWLGLDLTLFYKDIRDLLGTEIITTYNNAEYKRLSNADFGNVIGLTLALDQRAQGIASSSLDYTWQVAKGNSSDPYETGQRVDALEDPRPRQIPLNWDQRHTLNLIVTLSRPGNFNVSGVFRAVSGQPYTPASETGFGGTLETNSGRKPASFLMDLRAEKSFGPVSLGLKGFASVYNAFNTRFFNGAVFDNSGSPYYSRVDDDANRKALANATRYFSPRRIEVGIRWERGES